MLGLRRLIGQRNCSKMTMPVRIPTLNFPRTLLLASSVAFCASATLTAATPIPHGTLELIAENPWIAAGHTVNLGLRFHLEKGWHIYWINPGDSGEPPRVKWQLPGGLTVGAIEWPAPQRLGKSTVVDYGYEDAVTLIVPLHAEVTTAAQKTAQVTAQVSVLVCREMCVPGKAQISLTLPVKLQQPTTDVRTEDLFAATRKSLPRPAPGSWRFSVTPGKDAFVLTANLGRQISEATFYPLVESQIDNAAQQRLEPVPTGFHLTLRKSDQLLKAIDHLKGVLALSAGQAYLIDVPVGNGPTQ
jgi:DsbC/DsbD-like thiol-disulfide interchange protein